MDGGGGGDDDDDNDNNNSSTPAMDNHRRRDDIIINNNNNNNNDNHNGAKRRKREQDALPVHRTDRPEDDATDDDNEVRTYRSCYRVYCRVLPFTELSCRTRLQAPLPPPPLPYPENFVFLTTPKSHPAPAERQGRKLSYSRPCSLRDCVLLGLDILKK